MSCKSSVQRGSLRWWVWVLIFVGLPLVVLVWWWLRRQAEEATAPAARIELKVPFRAAEKSAPVPEPAPPTPDDLKRIEGIGPKISSVLHAAGITTFAQLAETGPDAIREVLGEASPNLLRLANPDSWPEQAKLAAEGQWEALSELQGKLKGGRRA